MSASVDALDVVDNNDPEDRGVQFIIVDAMDDDIADFLSVVQLQAEDFGGNLALPHYG